MQGDGRVPSPTEIANKLRECAAAKSPQQWENYRIKSIRSNGRNVDINGEHFSGCDFSGFTFSDFWFDGCDFSGAIFKDADYAGGGFRKGCNMEGCQLAFKLATRASFAGLDLSHVDMSGAMFDNCNFSNATFRENNVSGAQFLQNTKFNGAHFFDVTFEGCVVKGVKFKDADFHDTTFQLDKMESVYFNDADFDGGAFHVDNMVNCAFGGATLVNTKFDNTILRDSSLLEAEFVSEEAPLTLVQFLGCNLSQADFSGVSRLDECVFTDLPPQLGNDRVETNLDSAVFDGSILYRVRFEGVAAASASFVGSDLRTASIYRSKFEQCNFESCRVGKYLLESLGDQGVARSDELAMKVEYDLAELRLQFSGFWTALHLSALTLFLTPYIWFIVRQWPVASFDHAGAAGYISLWKALGLYIYNGGENMSGGSWERHWSFTIFVILFVVNVLRASLLFKTKALEHEAEASGQPSRFSYVDRLWGAPKRQSIYSVVRRREFLDLLKFPPGPTWGQLVFLNEIFLLINVLLSAGSFHHFMLQYIPLTLL